MSENEPMKGLRSYYFEAGAKGNITYGEMEFQSFKVREVYIDGNQKGEYHIKPQPGKDPAAAVLFLRGYFPDCSIGFTDPSGLLTLEYPIYLVCRSNPLVMETIPQIFEKIDEDLNGETVP